MQRHGGAEEWMKATHAHQGRDEKCGHSDRIRQIKMITTKFLMT